MDWKQNRDKSNEEEQKWDYWYTGGHKVYKVNGFCYFVRNTWHTKQGGHKMNTSAGKEAVLVQRMSNSTKSKP